MEPQALDSRRRNDDWRCQGLDERTTLSDDDIRAAGTDELRAETSDADMDDTDADTDTDDADADDTDA